MCSEALVICAAIFIQEYTHENQFFDCTLSVVVPREGPWKNVTNFSSGHDFLDPKIYFDEKFWSTIGN